MKKWKWISLVLIGIIAIGLLSACNLPSISNGISVEDRVATSVQQTQNANSDGQADTEEVVPDAATATATQTLQSSDTATATITLTPTQEKPIVSVSVDTNCRSGPGKIYDWIGALLVGENAEVVGRSVDGQYWVIKNPDRAGNCWLWGNYAMVTGPTAGLAQYTPPPTPTPVFYWAGNWTTYTLDPANPPSVSYPISFSVDGNEFTGLIDLGGGSYVNLTGTISEDFLSVTGTWISLSADGTFKFYALGANQFQGNGFNGMEVFGWCGCRSGAGEPSPCEKY